MNYRSLLFLPILFLVVFLAFKFDVPKKTKIILVNLVYGEEMRRIHDFHVVVDPVTPELEREGLTQEWLLQNCIEKMTKAGLKNLTDEEWQQTPGMPAIHLIANANVTKAGSGVYQYFIELDIEKSDLQGNAGSSAQEAKTIWSASDIGEGDVSKIRSKVNDVLDLFLKANSRG